MCHFFSICLATCLPASTGIDIYVHIYLGDVWAGEAGPGCGGEVGPGCARETGPCWAWEVGPGFQGKPGAVPELWPGRPAPTEAGATVVAGTLAPVEVGRLAPVSRGSQDLSLCCGWGGGSWVVASPTTVTELPLLKCISYVGSLRPWLPREARTNLPIKGWGDAGVWSLFPLGGPGFSGKPGPKAVVATYCI
jgi:hypothetical protein